jgi:hypothetical protein
MYNVVQQVNDAFDTSAGVAFVTPGVYTPTTLAAALDAQLKLLDATFSATYNAVTLRYTVTRATPVVWQFATGVHLARSIAPTLGFNAVDSTSSSITSDNASTLTDPEVVLIRCPELASGSPPNVVTSTTEYSTVVARIPMTGTLGGGSAHWAPTLPDEDVHYGTRGRVITDLTFSFWDEKTGNQLQFNGGDWSIEISLDVNEDKLAR